MQPCQLFMNDFMNVIGKKKVFFFLIIWIILMIIPVHIVMTWWHVFPGSLPVGYDDSSLDKNFLTFIL